MKNNQKNTTGYTSNPTGQGKRADVQLTTPSPYSPSRKSKLHTFGLVVGLTGFAVIVIGFAAFLGNFTIDFLGAEEPSITPSITQTLTASDPQAKEELAKEEEELFEEEEVEPITITISFAGDCTLGTDEYFSVSGSFNTAFSTIDDPSWFFASVYDIFSNDDLTIVNFEGTLTDSTARQDKTFAFKGDASYAQVLSEGSVEAVSLANNHTYDYGYESYIDTIEALDAVGVESFGYDRISYFEVEGVTIALIGTYELALGLGIESEMLENIQTAQDAGADIIAVYFHWGLEYESVPTDTQITLAHSAIDAGATIVVGSHPHIIQGYEEYNGRYIVYSLGNFCFGGNFNPSDKDCMIFQQTFTIVDGEVLIDDNINVIPCSISSTSSYNDYQPTPATDSEYIRILEKIEESNIAIATRSAELQAS